MLQEQEQEQQQQKQKQKQQQQQQQEQEEEEEKEEAAQKCHKKMCYKPRCDKNIILCSAPARPRHAHERHQRSNYNT